MKGAMFKMELKRSSTNKNNQTPALKQTQKNDIPSLKEERAAISRCGGHQR